MGFRTLTWGPRVQDPPGGWGDDELMMDGVCAVTSYVNMCGLSAPDRQAGRLTSPRQAGG